MPKFKIGNMWSVFDYTDLFLVTINSTLTTGRTLVMGAGIAGQAKRRFPGIERAFGKAIKQSCGSFGKYSLLISPRWPTTKLGAFQPKTDWQKPSSLSLIQNSAAMLKAWAENHPDQQIVLN